MAAVKLDKDSNIPIYSDVCMRCKHLDVDALSDLPRKRVCRAFPEGIPLAIWNGQNDHTRAYPGDHVVLFDPLTVAGAG